MKYIELSELKRLQVELLEKIHQFCKQNNIRYSLSYGTLIGAIRHHGYIPWDDDIDIMMPRPDYERFLEKFNGCFPDIFVKAPELIWSYYAPYANVIDTRIVLSEEHTNHLGEQIGMKIDVFPVDGAPSDEKDYLLLKKKVSEINEILAYKRWHWCSFMKALKKSKKSFAYAVYNRLAHIIHPYSYYQRKLHDTVTELNFDKEEYADILAFGVNFDTRLKRSIFESYTEVAFEGNYFCSIKDYDSFLSVNYGNYMKLPPLEEQIPHHGFKAYWK